MRLRRARNRGPKESRSCPNQSFPSLAIHGHRCCQPLEAPRGCCWRFPLATAALARQIQPQTAAHPEASAARARVRSPWVRPFNQAPLLVAAQVVFTRPTTRSRALGKPELEQCRAGPYLAAAVQVPRQLVAAAQRQPLARLLAAVRAVLLREDIRRDRSPAPRLSRRSLPVPSPSRCGSLPTSRS